MKFDNVPNSRIREIVDEYIHSERDRQIMKRIYIDDIHYESLAEELNLSVSTINRVHQKHKHIVETLL